MGNENSFFTPLKNTRPFLKMAFQGFAGDGKTYTMALISIGLYRQIKSTKPIVIYDTEKSSKALVPLFEKHKIEVQVKESRTLADLVKTIEFCEQGYSDILLIDSITHTYEGFLNAYMEQKNRTRLEFQDWGVVKPAWKKQFSDKFVMGKLHIMFTGRAGYEYENELDERGKKQIVKSGIKMKAENETAFEPDILVEMAKVKDYKDGRTHITREATIIKDRTTLIDGKTFVNPTFADFEPAIKQLLNGTANETEPVETKDVFKDEDYTEKNKKDTKEVALDEIKENLTMIFPASTGNDKKMKLLVLDKVFATPSWTLIEKSLDLDTLKQGRDTIKIFKTKFLKKFPTSESEVTEELIKECIADAIEDYKSLNENPIPA